jgi:hypothetical protein
MAATSSRLSTCCVAVDVEWGNCQAPRLLGSLGVKHAWVGEREKVIIAIETVKNRSSGATKI